MLSSKWPDLLRISGKKWDWFLTQYCRTAKPYECTDSFGSYSYAASADRRLLLWLIFRNLRHFQLTRYSTLRIDPEKILSTLSNKITKDFPPYPQIHTQIKYVQKSMEDYLSPAFYMIGHRQHFWKCNLHQQRTHHRQPLSLHHPRPRRLPRTFISECLLCKPSSRSNPLCAELWRIHRGLGHLQRDDELLLFHTDERAGYIISTQLICHSGTICTYRYGNPLRWLEACRCGGFFHTYGITDDATIEDIYDLIIADPANYLKYYIGYLEFLELKKNAVDKWEDNFTQMQFHKAVLDVGPASFDVIRAYLF